MAKRSMVYYDKEANSLRWQSAYGLSWQRGQWSITVNGTIVIMVKVPNVYYGNGANGLSLQRGQ